MTENFIIEGLSFFPQQNTRISWDPNMGMFSVYGSLQTVLDGENLSFSLGDANNPGLTLLGNGTILQFSGVINDDFIVKGMFMSLGEEETLLSFDPVFLQFEITGKVMAHFAGEVVESSLSTTDDPGILITDGQIEHVHIHIGKDFSVASLANSDPDILLKWTEDDDFAGHGKMWITIQDGLALAYLGSNAKPGLILNGGILDSMNMEIVGGAVLFDVLPTVGLFQIQYSREEGSFNITGEVATELPFVREGKKFGPYIVIDAGLGSAEGIVYDTDKKKLFVENASFSIKGLNKGKSQETVEVGGFELKELTLTIEDNLPAGIGGKVEVPPGADVDADLEFEIDVGDPLFPFKIHSISVSYLAESMEAVIPMGNSGFSLVTIGGSITGMEDPANAIYSGCLGLIYGDLIPLNFVVKTTNGALAYFEADVVISAHELVVGASAALGAYQGPDFLNMATDETPCPPWTPLLGEGNLDMDLQWGVQYSVDGHLQMLAVDPFIKADLKAKLSAGGNFDAKAEVDLVIPHSIPIVGGKTLESIEGVIRYLPKHQNQSYAAGWTKLNFGFDHVFVGAELNLGTGHIGKLGSRAAKKLVADVENDPTGSPQVMIPTSTVYHTFEVSSDPLPLYLQCDFIATDLSHLDLENGNITLTLIGPSASDKYQIYLSDDQLIDDVGFIYDQQGSSMTIQQNKFARYGFYAVESTALNPNATDNFSGQPDAFMTPGTYTLKIDFFETDGTAFSEDDFELQISPVYPRPTLNDVFIDIYPNNEIYYQLNFLAYLPDSATIALYTNDTISYQGGQLKESWAYDESDIWPADTTRTLRILAAGFNSRSVYFDLQPDSILFVYAVIDDHVNPPVYSSFHQVKAQTRIRGTLVPETGSFDPQDTFRIVVYEDGMVKASTIADSNGRFEFFGPDQNKSYRLDISTSDSGFYISPNISTTGSSASSTLLYQDWLRIETSGTLEDIIMNIELSEKPPLIYGAVHEPGQAGSISGVEIILFDATDSLALTSVMTNETGYSFNIDWESDEYFLKYILPAPAVDGSGTYHWDPHYFYEESVTFDGGSGVRTEVVRFPVGSGASNPKELNLIARSGIRGPVFIVSTTDPTKPYVFFENISITLTGDQGTKLTAVTNVYGSALFESTDLAVGETYTVTSSVPEGYSSNEEPMPFTWTLDDPYLRLQITPQN